MIQTEYPREFTEDQLLSAYKAQADQGWTGDVGRSAAAMTLLGHQAPCDQVEALAARIQKALDGRG